MKQTPLKHLKLSREIALTIGLKLILLYALWWVCSLQMNPHRLTSEQWFLGEKSSNMTSVDSLNSNRSAK